VDRHQDDLDALDRRLPLRKSRCTFSKRTPETCGLRPCKDTANHDTHNRWSCWYRVRVMRMDSGPQHRTGEIGSMDFLCRHRSCYSRTTLVQDATVLIFGTVRCALEYARMHRPSRLCPATAARVACSPPQPIEIVCAQIPQRTEVQLPTGRTRVLLGNHEQSVRAQPSLRSALCQACSEESLVPYRADAWHADTGSDPGTILAR
jgi:hypothetical protein